MRKPLSISLLLLMLWSVGVQAQDYSGTPDEICEQATPAEEPETRQYSQPEQVLEEGVDYRAIFCTEEGAVYVDLFEDLTPITVNSFIFLAENGYYNNTTFHRVMEGFMAQGGDPTATGGGHPGYRFPDEFVNFLTFDGPGWLAMANSGANTNGSQFFITTDPALHLNGRHTIFGQVLEGQENVEELRIRVPEDPDFDESIVGSALDTVVIITDPDAVETTWEEPAPATLEDVQLLLTELTNNLPPDLIIVGEEVGPASVDDLPEAVADLYTVNGYDFSESLALDNSTCDPQIPFASLRYRIDAFDSPDSVATVYADEVISAALEDEGLTLNEDGLELPTYYTEDVAFCDDTPGIRVVSITPHAHFLARSEAVFSKSFLEENGIPADIALNRIVNATFEQVLASAYRPPLR